MKPKLTKPDICDLSWSDNTAGKKSDNPLVKEMNKLQELRKKELDIAIKALSSDGEKKGKE